MSYASCVRYGTATASTRSESRPDQGGGQGTALERNPERLETTHKNLAANDVEAHDVLHEVVPVEE